MLRRLASTLDKYFHVLEIKPGSSSKEIKTAYNRLVKLYHPDTTQIQDKNVAAEKFKQVHYAKNALLNANPQKDTYEEDDHSTKPHYKESVFKSYEDFKKHHEKREDYKKQEFYKRQNSKPGESKADWSSKSESFSEQKPLIDPKNYFSLAVISICLTAFYIYLSRPTKRVLFPPIKPEEIPVRQPVFLQVVPNERRAPRNLAYFYEGKKGPHMIFLLLSAEDDDHSVFKCKTCHAVVSKANLEDHVIYANLQDSRKLNYTK